MIGSNLLAIPIGPNGMVAFKWSHFIQSNFSCSLVWPFGSSVTSSSIDFSFQNLVFGNLFEIAAPEITSKSISPTFWIQKSYQINSIKSYSSRSFQQHQRHIPIPPKVLVTIWFNFQRQNHSIFKNFCTTSPNVMELSPWTPPHWKLSKDTKNMMWSIPIWWIS
jgi:hypothetical protein